MKTDERTLALLFASAQLKADQRTLLSLSENTFTDRSMIQHALEAIESTRKIISKALGAN